MNESLEKKKSNKPSANEKALTQATILEYAQYKGNRPFLVCEVAKILSYYPLYRNDPKNVISVKLNKWLNSLFDVSFIQGDQNESNLNIISKSIEITDLGKSALYVLNAVKLPITQLRIKALILLLTVLPVGITRNNLSQVYKNYASSMSVEIFNLKQKHNITRKSLQLIIKKYPDLLYHLRCLSV